MITKWLIIFLARGISVTYCTSLKFNKICPFFSRGRTHDLFDRWNHVKLCVGFLCFIIFSSPLLVARRSCSFRYVVPVIGIRAYLSWGCSGQFLTYIKIRTRVPPHQKLLKADDKISRPNTSLQNTIWFPRGRSSFREHRHPETSSSISSNMTVAINSIDIRLYIWSPLHSQNIPYFKQCNNPYSNADCYIR